MKLLTLLASIALATGAASAPQAVDPTALRLPQNGDYGLQVLTPSLLELTVVTTAESGARPLVLPAGFRSTQFRVECDGVVVETSDIGFKRRVLYAPLRYHDLRVATEIYLRLSKPLPADATHTVKVTAQHSPLWPPEQVFEATTDPLRYSPVIHVNQEGYVPEYAKLAQVGYFAGTLGEVPIPVEGGFDLIDTHSGKSVFHGPLRARRDLGFMMTPRPYQAVYEADFTAFKEPGEYRLAVTGLGASLPFRIEEGELMNFARTYALGLFHQRCGEALELPYTRFTHDACHVAPAEVPMPAADFPKAWDIIAKLVEESVKSEHPEQQLTDPGQQLYPFVKLGRVDVRGGHHDAGDYSKYTINSAALIHTLIFAVDSFPGVAELDNLGLPESGDGVGDVLQEAKWESDFLAKLQDEDGGFYFLVYPKERRYETDVTPDKGDPQIVWPKTTASTAAAVAALAQCASSPAFKKQYPDVARRYLTQAERGWKFLLDALSQHGKDGSYQRLTHYGDAFQADDELAWAACELFVATGNPAYEQKLFEWFRDPSSPATREYGWHRASYSYGNAMRSYAFAASSGRQPREKLDAGYLLKCETELRRAGDDAVHWSQQSAYGTSYPEPSKRINAVGWYFSNDLAFDITVAYQLERRPGYTDAILANINYDLGSNPVNITFVTGLGTRRQREIVHQFAQNDERVLPPSGIPLGSLQSHFPYLGQYKTELRDLSWPRDEGAGIIYPLYDRWSDTYNLDTEFVIVDQARALANTAFWAAQTALKSQKWRSETARIVGPGKTVPLYQPVTFRLECPSLDLSSARIVWEGRDQEPAFGSTYTMTPRRSGPQWVEAEATLPDGRRVVARGTFSANAPVVLWVDGALPRGATPAAQGGDNWGWIKAATKPPELASHLHRPQHESALAEGIHEHGFYDAADTLTIDKGDVLFAYVFIDPRHVPETIMLEWNDGSTEHRAFWGRNEIPYGHMNTDGQRPMGPLPPAGKWVRLDVPASAVGLEGHTVKGLVFRLHGGRVRWDAAGKMSAAAKELGFFHPPPPVD
jgi:hypothetical protein